MGNDFHFGKNISKSGTTFKIIWANPSNLAAFWLSSLWKTVRRYSHTISTNFPTHQCWSGRHYGWNQQSGHWLEQLWSQFRLISHCWQTSWLIFIGCAETDFSGTFFGKRIHSNITPLPKAAKNYYISKCQIYTRITWWDPIRISKGINRCPNLYITPVLITAYV